LTLGGCGHAGEPTATWLWPGLGPLTTTHAAGTARCPPEPRLGVCRSRHIARPARRACAAWSDVSPHVDPRTGVYRAGRDRGNWVPLGGRAVLELVALHVVDNGEGDDWPHGPYGNLYWDVFAPDEDLSCSPDGADRRRVGRARVLRGPHRTHGTTDEWLDDEVLRYRDAGLYRWGAWRGTEDTVVLRIWESDGLAEDGAFGRRNDVLGMERIDRLATEPPCGLWVALHRYSSAHPRTRLDDVAAWALVRTWPPARATTAVARGE
jgi:hypothetical protein